MIKKITLLGFCFVLLFSTALINAQNIDREPLGKYSYTQLPSDTKLVDFKTYKVISMDFMDAYKTDKLVATINLTGYEKKSKDQTADFTVEIQEYPLKFSDPERKTTEETYKSDGVEKKRTYYYYTANVNFTYKLRIYATTENILFSKEESGSEIVIGTKNESSSTAYDSFTKEKKKYIEENLSTKVSLLNSSINETLCTLIKTETVESALIKPKKFAYDDYNEFFGNMKEGFAIVAANENAIEESRVSLEKAIEGFKKMLTESNPEERKSRVNNQVTALLWADIGICHFLLKEYDKAQTAFTTGSEFKNNVGDMQRMINLSANLQKRKLANVKG